MYINECVFYITQSLIIVFYIHILCTNYGDDAIKPGKRFKTIRELIVYGNKMLS